jgi:hypothetical protein
MEDMERRLSCSLVAHVGGSRPAVSREQVTEAFVQRADVPRGAFTVHRFKPQDFLIVFAAPEFKARVAARQSLPFSFFTLHFRQWTRQAQARHVVLRTKVFLAVEGVPAHGVGEGRATIAGGRFLLTGVAGAGVGEQDGPWHFQSGGR